MLAMSGGQGFFAGYRFVAGLKWRRVEEEGDGIGGGGEGDVGGIVTVWRGEGWLVGGSEAW